MNQLNFFDNPPARRGDPITSKIAAVEVQPKLAGYRKVFADRLRHLGQATAQEVALGQESIRKRAKELERAGIVKVVGARRCRRTGKTASVYELSKGSHEHSSMYTKATE